MKINQLVTITLDPVKQHIDFIRQILTPQSTYPKSAPITYYAPQEHGKAAPRLMDAIRKLLSFCTLQHKDEARLVESED